MNEVITHDKTMRILCVHQGYELYGSDRSFMQTIEALKVKYPNSIITAIIPKRGELYEPLQEVADVVMIDRLWVPRKAELKKLFTTELVRFPFAVYHAYKRMKTYDMVYINTLTIMDYNVAARFVNTPSIIHVREILGGKASKLFSAVLRFSRAHILYNSVATEKAFSLHPRQPREVIYNGVEIQNEVPAPVVEKDDTLKLLVIGRFSSWKGQDVLVEAIAKLSEAEQQKVAVRLVGGVFEDQHHFKDDVQALIEKHNLQDTVKINDFTSDTAAVYQWADILVVPSKKPEPFGRVAIEGMSYSRAVIAADHGGLSEIVLDGETGALVAPDNANALADGIRTYLASPEKVQLHGKAARDRFVSTFSQDRYATSIGESFEALYNREGWKAASRKAVNIMGIRGVPAAHGGYETFADYFSRYLVEKGWDVTVYCQEEGEGEMYTDTWEGVTRIHIPVKGDGAKSTIIFDMKSICHAAKTGKLALTLGYNTAIFNTWFRIKSVTNIINMDGIEWKRGKWSTPIKIWFWFNEVIGCFVSDHMIADHPQIKKHLQRIAPEKKITVSAYGAKEVKDADASLLEPLGLSPHTYSTVIARPEPENSILEMVKAFSAKPRDTKLVVLGNFKEDNDYQQSIKQAASDDVLFPGAIYDKDVLNALRFYGLMYLHGHTVGGTNPSLLEALGAGNPVLAHDNHFNRWVAGEGAAYFTNQAECEVQMDRLLGDKEALKAMSQASRARYAEAFTWDAILLEQEEILKRFL